MSRSKSKRKPTPPTLNAIYRQQLLLRDAVRALTAVLTESQAHCERLQFDKGVLAERVLKAKAAARVPTPNERDEDLTAVQGLIDTLKIIDKLNMHREEWLNGAVLAYNAIMALKPMTAAEAASKPTQVADLTREWPTQWQETKHDA